MKKIGLLIFIGIIILSACSNKSSETASFDGSQNNTSIDHLESLEQNLAAWSKTTPSDDEIAKVVELDENGSIYYFAADNKRYIFPTPETYTSWFGSNQPGRTMPLEEMQDIPLGGNVTVRPGSLISTPSDSKIYLVKQGGIISAVNNKTLKTIHGKNYRDKVLNIANYYFTNYTYGDAITTPDDYPLTIITLTIDKDKGLETDN